jgi:hypothetical protein
MSNQIKLLETASYKGIKIYTARLIDWTKLNVKSSINLFRPSQDEVDQAIEQAKKDMFECIIVYELTDFEFKALRPMYVNVA